MGFVDEKPALFRALMFVPVWRSAGGACSSSPGLVMEEFVMGDHARLVASMRLAMELAASSRLFAKLFDLFASDALARVRGGGDSTTGRRGSASPSCSSCATRSRTRSAKGGVPDRGPRGALRHGGAGLRGHRLGPAVPPGARDDAYLHAVRGPRLLLEPCHLELERGAARKDCLSRTQLQCYGENA